MSKKVVRDKMGRIIKGGSPWNKGTKGLIKPNSGSFSRDKTLGKNNVKWLGDGVGYFGLHSWVNRKLGKPQLCYNCRSTENVEWANKSHKYDRNVSDWLSLCHKCHIKYDRNSGTWGLASRMFDLKKTGGKL